MTAEASEAMKHSMDSRRHLVSEASCRRLKLVRRWPGTSLMPRIMGLQQGTRAAGRHGRRRVCVCGGGELHS